MLTLNPELVEPRIRLAAIRLKQNSPRSALDVLGSVKDSSDPRVLELLCNIYLKLNRNSDALDALRRLGAVSKGRADAQRTLALLEIQMGQTDQGIKDLSQAVARDPFNAALVGPLVSALAQAGRYGEALAVADRMGTDPKNRSQALVYRGSILALQRDLAGAQAAFDKAVKNDPRNVPVLYSRAEFAASQQRLADANRDLRTILSLDTKNIPAFLKLADIAAQQGQDQNVRTILNQAIASSPGNATPRLSLMRYLNAQQKFKEALTVAGDLLRTQPNNTDCLALVGQAQLSLGQKKESVATYRRLVSLMPTAAAPQVFLGNALSAAGDRTGAARALDAAVKLSPDAPDVKGAQINLLFTQGSVDAAVASARAFRTAYPGTAGDVLLADTLDRAKLQDEALSVVGKSFSDKPNTAVLLRLVRFAVQANDRKRAGDLMSAWLSANPNDVGVRQAYAMFLMQQNSNAQAVVQFRAILKQDPNNVVALNNLGWLLQASEPKQALSLLSLAQKLSPNSPDVADTLGWAKVQQKDAAGGLALLTRAHTMAPQNGDITFHLVQALDAGGQREAARKLLTTLLTSGTKFNDQPAAVKLAAAWR
jgi:putative PEP-CTERM system TPR-repeat lipoprotein